MTPEEEARRLAERLSLMLDQCEEELPKAKARADRAALTGRDAVLSTATAAWWSARTETIIEIVRFGKREDVPLGKPPEAWHA